jgi:GxxExxY protein
MENSGMDRVKVPGSKVLYPELSYEIMNIIFEVHNRLGPGFTEDIYEKAVIYELQDRHIPYEAQKNIDVFYKGQKIGIYRLDLIVDDKIILELKAVSVINDVYKHQLLSYLRATGLRLGILINFGGMKVQSFRVVS